jgi:SAM-dependent methyltransferase
MKQEDAEEYTQSLGQIVAGSYRQVQLAKRLGVPDALRLSVREWVEQRLGGYIKYSITERREAVRNLTADGETQRGVAEILGVSNFTVSEDVRNLTAETRKAGEDARKAILEAPVDPEILPGIYVEDFYTGSDRIADDSVDLIFTDPPYDKDSVSLYRKAAQVAARILKPGGSFVAYSGQKYLPEVYGLINHPAYSVILGQDVTAWFFGGYLLQFSGTGPHDSEWIKWGPKRREITEEQLAALLRFDLDPDTLGPLEIRRHHASPMPPLFSGIPLEPE